MYLEVYPDIVFLINFFIDFILIFLVKKVNKKCSSLLRLALAAATGGICAVIECIFPWMNPIVRFAFMYFASSLLMIIIAFGRLKLSDIVKQWIVLNLITYFVGGFMNSVYYHTNIRLFLINISNRNFFGNLSGLYVIVSVCIITIVTLVIVWVLRLYLIHKPLIYDVELVLKNRHVRTRGLMDTGNCLYDPIHRKPVMVMENSLADKLMTPKIKLDMENAICYLEGKSDDMPLPEDNEQGFRFCFIPYRSVGRSGMLLGIKLDKVMIHTDKESICNEKVTAAICDNRLTCCKRDYHVILHKELL